MLQNLFVIGENVRKRREMLGMSQEDLARKIGGATKQQSIQQLEAGEVKHPRYFNRLLAVLDCTYEQLLNGQFNEIGEPRGKDLKYSYTLSRDANKRLLVPLVSWQRAGANEFAADQLETTAAEDWIVCPAKEYSDRTFALEVTGDAMTAPFGRNSYPEGILIFIDPARNEEVKPGDCVVARLADAGGLVFRQLAENRGELFLKPLNPQYPAIHDPFEIVGKIIFAGWEP